MSDFKNLIVQLKQDTTSAKDAAYSDSTQQDAINVKVQEFNVGRANGVKNFELTEMSQGANLSCLLAMQVRTDV